MIDKKHFNIVIAVLMILAVAVCVLGIYFSDTLSEQIETTGISMDYESKLFDTSSPIEINIEMDDDTWDELLENPLSEEYYSCNVLVNGTEFVNVGIRTKGNTSLSNIANDDTTDRYSFKLEFDNYIEEQTCFGLDKLVLNNNYADATNMKEALVYDMFQFLDADASLYNYAKVSVNGNYWGVYLALESVEDSFQLRNYGVSNGKLYKPESTQLEHTGDENMDNAAQNKGERPQMGNADNNMTPPTNFDNDTGGASPPDFDTTAPGTPPTDFDTDSMETSSSDIDTISSGTPPTPNNDFNKKEQQNGGMGGFSQGASTLNYIDDDLDSYDVIWDSEVSSTSKKDHQKVVEALKNISAQTNVEEYMDVENVIKYLAVHTFAVNLDSLSGNMAHNYYLYEQDGQLNIIPWDYNLAWGGFQSNDASSTINFAIDTPFSNGTSMEDRQFFAAILENEEYLELYHSYLRQLCEEYIYGDGLDSAYNRIRSQIDSLVEEDPTAFYSYEEYDAAATMLYQVLQLRADSVLGQLDGSIPSTNEGQNEDSSTLIDASEINLSVMGSMQGGGMNNNMQGGMKNDNHDSRPDNMQNIPKDGKTAN